MIHEENIDVIIFAAYRSVEEDAGPVPTLAIMSFDIYWKIIKRFD